MLNTNKNYKQHIKNSEATLPLKIEYTDNNKQRVIKLKYKNGDIKFIYADYFEWLLRIKEIEEDI